MSNPLDLYKEAPPNPNASVVIALVTTRNRVHAMTAVSLMAMPKPSFGVVVANDMPVDVGRNYCVRKFLESKNATHLFFTDSDMWYPPNTLLQLLADDLPVVGGLCYQRDKPFAPVIINRRPFVDGGITCQWIPYEKHMEGKIIECDATGAACLLIRREVFEQIEQPWFKFTTVDKHSRVDVGEDIYFFDKCKAAGIRCNVDTRVLCQHAADTTVIIPKYFQEDWIDLGDESLKLLQQAGAGWALAELGKKKRGEEED